MRTQRKRCRGWDTATVRLSETIACPYAAAMVSPCNPDERWVSASQSKQRTLSRCASADASTTCCQKVAGFNRSEALGSPQFIGTKLRRDEQPVSAWLLVQDLYC